MSSHAPGASLNSSCLRLRSDDTVAVAIEALPAGARVVVGDVSLVLREDVPAGDKLALKDVVVGGLVRKYGYVIGVATRAIYAGEHVHTHNLAFAGAVSERAFGPDASVNEPARTPRAATFQGIVRPDARVATRNYIGILTTVNCSATVARMVAGQFAPALNCSRAFPMWTAS